MKALLVLALLLAAIGASACQVSLNGILHECAVYPDDHLLHCVPILPGGNFTPAPK